MTASRWGCAKSLILNKKKSLKKVKKEVDKPTQRVHNMYMLNKKQEGFKMTNKTFSVAGVSTLNGKTKVRFANDFVSRFKILAKNGHQDINLIELGGEFTKAEVCQILMAHPNFQDEASQTAIAEFVVRNVKQVTKTATVEDAELESA